MQHEDDSASLYDLSSFSINFFIDRSISDTTPKARNKLPKCIFRRTKAIPTLRRTCKFALCAFQFTCFPFFTDRRYTLSSKYYRFESAYVRFSISSSSGDLGRSEEKKTLCMRFDSYDRIHARPYYERVRKIRKRLISKLVKNHSQKNALR